MANTDTTVTLGMKVHDLTGYSVRIKIAAVLVRLAEWIADTKVRIEMTSDGR